MSAPITLKLPEDLKALLVEQAKAEGKTPHDYMVEALTGKAQRIQRQRLLDAEDDAALEEFERTGIAYSMEDVHEYFIALAAGKKPPRPKPVKVPRK